MTRLPTLFLSHGGGPWPFMEDRRVQYAKTAQEFGRLPQLLPERPKAVLVITGHWEADALDYRFRPSNMVDPAYKSFVSVPILDQGGECLGVLCIDSANPHTFDDERIEQWLDQICDAFAAALISLGVDTTAQ